MDRTRAAIALLGLIVGLTSASPAFSAGTQPRHSVKVHDLPLASEQYITFVDSRSDSDGDCSPWFYRGNQINWTRSAKRKIDVAIAEIHKKAPGLLARACNGEKISLRLFSGEAAAAETDPTQIAVYTNLLSAPTHYAAETLAHEMTHLIDYGANLSDSKEWNSLICARLSRYRKEFPDPDKLDQPREMHRADKRLKELGIPDDYAAENPSEALAEYAAVIACSGFCAPASIKSYIEANVLSLPPAQNEKARLVRSACRAMNRQDDDEAIREFTKLLRIDSKYVFAYWFLGMAWWEKNEPEIASFNLRYSRDLMRRNDVPAYSDDLMRVSALLKDLDEEAADADRARSKVPTVNTVSIVALHGKKK